MLYQCCQVVPGTGFPAIVQVQTCQQTQLLLGIFVIFGGFTKNQLRYPAAFIAHGSFFVGVVFPSLTEHIFIENFIRILQPTQKPWASLKMNSLSQLTWRNLHFSQTTVLSGRCALDAFSQTKITHVTIGWSEDIGISGWRGTQL